MSEELKPCGFCGEAERESLITDVVAGLEPNHYYSHVKCENCGASGPVHHGGESEQSAREGAEYLWNDRTRAPAWRDISTAPKDTIEDLAKTLCLLEYDDCPEPVPDSLMPLAWVDLKDRYMRYAASIYGIYMNTPPTTQTEGE